MTALPNMLGLAVACALLVAGCVAHQPGLKNQVPGARSDPGALQATHSAPSASRETGGQDTGSQRLPVVVDDVTSELGSEAADDLPPSPPPPKPVDAGAAAVVTAIASALDRIDAGNGGPVIVRLMPWRNQSHASPHEADQAARRLADLLNDSRGGHAVRFTTDDDAGEDFALHATAYLVTDRGFDLWELFLRLTPADGSWTAWSPNGPIRLLRANRPGSPQVYIGPGVLD